ncbi:protein zerknuellt 1-like [Ostrinia nubilalis]|uniref:protein zerknuellt 1-like n=1 Tax=Ostrinia nubilalis TaxID=29057 RepID=UPI0030822719
MHPWNRPGGSGDHYYRLHHHHQRHIQETTEETFRTEVSEVIDLRGQQIPIKKSKRNRLAFTTEQINFLEMEFKKFPYIDKNQRKVIADYLNIPEKAIKVWFQNRRMREKKDQELGYLEIDDQRFTSPVDFVNEEIGVSTQLIPLINEPPNPNPLPELTVSPMVSHVEHIDLTDSEPNSGQDFDTDKLKYYKESISPVPETIVLRSPKAQSSKSTKSSSQSEYRSSAEFSIDLCKKYQNIVKEPQSKTEEVRTIPVPVPTTPPRLPRRQRVSRFEQQSLPEDLSIKSSSKSRLPSPQTSVSPSNSGLIPVYVNYTQSLLSAGNILWKPVNVVPIMQPGVPGVNVPGIVPGNPPGPLLRAPSPHCKKCKCNCRNDAPPSTTDAPPSISTESSSSPQVKSEIATSPNKPK